MPVMLDLSLPRHEYSLDLCTRPILDTTKRQVFSVKSFIAGCRSCRAAAEQRQISSARCSSPSTCDRKLQMHSYVTNTGCRCLNFHFHRLPSVIQVESAQQHRTCQLLPAHHYQIQFPPGTSLWHVGSKAL